MLHGPKQKSWGCRGQRECLRMSHGLPESHGLPKLHGLTESHGLIDAAENTALMSATTALAWQRQLEHSSSTTRKALIGAESSAVTLHMLQQPSDPV